MKNDEAKEIIDFLVGRCSVSYDDEHKLSLGIRKCSFSGVPYYEFGVISNGGWFQPLYAINSHMIIAAPPNYAYGRFEEVIYKKLLDLLLEVSSHGNDIFFSCSMHHFRQTLFLKANTTLEELLVQMDMHNV